MKLRTFILMMIIWLVIPALAQDKKGWLNINTVPDNATVSIDDELAGTTPLTLLNITAGKHRVIIKKEGYTTVERIIEVPADEIKKVEILLTPVKQMPVEKTPAEPIKPVPASEKAQLQKPILELGGEISKITYSEPGVMEERGTMFGITGSYTSYKDVMLRVEGRMSLFGEVDYEGSYGDGTPLSIKNIKDYIAEFRGLVGLNLLDLLDGRKNSMSTTDSPYLLYGGIGYRFLSDDSSKDKAGYKRESTYIYLPIGIEKTDFYQNGWSVTTILEYDLFCSGEQKSYLSDADPGLNDLTNKQTKGYGYRISMKFQKERQAEGNKKAFAIEPFLRYWNIGRSKKADLTYWGQYAGYGYEPENNSTEIGLRLGVIF